MTYRCAVQANCVDPGLCIGEFQALIIEFPLGVLSHMHQGMHELVYTHTHPRTIAVF